MSIIHAEVYTKETRATRLTIPTGSKISHLCCRIEHGMTRAQVQADALTIAAGSWEMYYQEDLPWDKVAIIIVHTTAAVTVELRVDPV